MAPMRALVGASSQDASLRVRRAAMRLLSTVTVRNGTDLAQRLVHAIALKFRDKCANLHLLWGDFVPKEPLRPDGLHL